jgi:hypothetical protein
MKLSAFREADNCSTSKEIPSILWNQTVRYRTHKSPPLMPILSQMNPVHSLSSCLLSCLFSSQFRTYMASDDGMINQHETASGMRTDTGKRSTRGISTWPDMRLSPGRRSRKPVTKRLSYGHSPCHPISWRSITTLYSNLYIILVTCFLQVFLPKLCSNLPCTMSATCYAHRILLDWIIITIFGEECKLWNSSLRNFS